MRRLDKKQQELCKLVLKKIVWLQTNCLLVRKRRYYLSSFDHTLLLMRDWERVSGPFFLVWLNITKKIFSHQSMHAKHSTILSVPWYEVIVMFSGRLTMHAFKLSGGWINSLTCKIHCPKTPLVYTAWVPLLESHKLSKG